MDTHEQRISLFKDQIEKKGMKVDRTDELGSHNNFVYLFHLTSSLHEDLMLSETAVKPGISAIPKGTLRIICRMSSPDANLNEDYRIQNQVAIMSLAKSALSSFPNRIVPMVFDWKDTTPNSPGWMIYEWMSGEPVKDDDFTGFDVEKQNLILVQVAKIVKALQDFELPTSHFGGIGYDEEGNLVGRAMTIPCGGPFSSYADLCKGMLEWQLAARNTCRILVDRDTLKIGERFKQFVADKNGMERVLSSCQVVRPVIVHGDLLRVNFLFDPDTLQISAILDWDLAHIAAPISEYLHSLGDVFGLLGSTYEEEEGYSMLRNCQLHGFPSPLPVSTPLSNPEDAHPGATGVQWELAKAWDSHLADVEAVRPRNISGAAEISDFWWFTQELCPWYFLQERKLAKIGPEKVERFRKASERSLDAQLKQWGF